MDGLFNCEEVGTQNVTFLMFLHPSFCFLTVRFMYQAFLVFAMHDVRNFSLINGTTSKYYILSADVSVAIKSVKYYIITLAVGSISLAFNVLPLLLLFLYPTKAFRARLSKCRFDGYRIALNIFVEKFHYCYRDGLEGGRDMRSFSALYFALRGAVFMVNTLNINTLYFEAWFARGLVYSVAALLVALCRPYKKTSMNVLDTLLLSYLATFYYMLSSNYKSRFFLPLMQTVILFPFFVFCTLTAVKICKTQFQRSLAVLQNLRAAMVYFATV